MTHAKLSRRNLAATGVILLFLAVAQVSTGATSALIANAAPLVLECQTAVLTAPLPDSVLSGAVEVRGRALVSDFQFYKVEYSPLGAAQWVLIGTDVVRQPVENGLLVTWATRTVPDGAYRLRLHVVDSTGNYCEVVLASLTVSNARPRETDTVEPTETPVLTAVQALTTPTILLSLPVEFSPVQGTPATLPRRSPALGMSGFNLSMLGVFFLFGASVMFGTALFVGVVIIVRKWG